MLKQQIKKRFLIVSQNGHIWDEVIYNTTIAPATKISFETNDTYNSLYYDGHLDKIDLGMKLIEEDLSLWERYCDLALTKEDLIKMNKKLYENMKKENQKINLQSVLKDKNSNSL